MISMTDIVLLLRNNWGQPIRYYRKPGPAKEGYLLLQLETNHDNGPRFYPVYSVGDAIVLLSRLADQRFDTREYLRYDLLVFRDKKWQLYRSEYGDTIDDLMGCEM